MFTLEDESDQECLIQIRLISNICWVYIAFQVFHENDGSCKNQIWHEVIASAKMCCFQAFRLMSTVKTNKKVENLGINNLLMKIEIDIFIYQIHKYHVCWTHLGAA